jgi:hypothetical protein
MTNGTAGSFNMERIHKAIEAYFDLIEQDFVPYCPQLSVFCEFMQPNRIPYEQWLELDMGYIDDSDVVLRIPGPSPGADRECKYAHSKGKPVVNNLAGVLEYRNSREACNETSVTNSIA